MNTLLTIDLVAVALFAGFCVAKVVPSCNMSIFRYRLWGLRDRLVDQIRDGAFDDDERAREVLEFVEVAITAAPDIGAVKLLFARWSCRGVPVSAPFRLDGLSANDKSLLGQYLNEFHHYLVRHILLGNPSGWVLTAVAFPVAFIATLVERARRRGDGDKRSLIGAARGRMRDEVDPGLALLGGDHAAAHSLSHMI